ncbi:MAG: hypothetical protein ACI8P9_005542 [Parasphingorhabdus sp.]|jgi:hypothetical protein
MSGKIYLGTQDFNHDSWNGGFYESELPVEWRFQHYANQLRSILISPDQVKDVEQAQIGQFFEDSDVEFSFVLSMMQQDLLEFETHLWPSYWSKLESRIAGFQVVLEITATQQNVTDNLPVINWLKAIAPICVGGNHEHVDTVFPEQLRSALNLSRTWQVADEKMPQTEGELLLVFTKDPDLLELRKIIEVCAAWSSKGRNAGIFFSPTAKSAENAFQGRLLLEMMGC